LLNNGAILKASVGNISCFDISKHTTGTLRQNLQELGCTIQKGDFDYSLGDDWECMSNDDQADCLKYLQGDVLGLKELSERLNQSCYEKFGVNVYKYLSTSQLTYASWINFLYSDTNDPVFLPTAEQVKFFRSIYGGRTYKYKHKFVSSQREAYMNKQIPCEDIDDYPVDADVNSLYPAK
jgi:DNA polymerase type B, organellar and viral